MTNVQKILFAAVLFVIIGIATLFMAVFSQLSGQLYEEPRIIAIGAISYLALVFFQFKLFTSRRRIVLFCLAALAAIVLTSIKPWRYESERSIPTVSTEVDIHHYEPFTNSPLLARLNHPASLQLQPPLPALDGATALYPIYASFVEAVYPSASYSPHDSLIRMSKTPQAYERLQNGEADLIFAAAPDDQQRAQLGPELALTPIAREAFVFFVHRKNPINSLTVQQIQDIYTGKITNWKEVGGQDATIRAFQRPAGSGSQSALIRFMDGKPLAPAPEEDIALFMGGIITQVAEYRNFPNAIGYSFRFFSTEMIKNGEIKLLAINGIAPTRDTILSEQYPITEQIYAVTAGTQNPNIQPLIDWILSSEGQEIIEKTGYVPILPNTAPKDH